MSKQRGKQMAGINAFNPIDLFICEKDLRGLLYSCNIAQYVLCLIRYADYKRLMTQPRLVLTYSITNVINTHPHREKT